ncbi:hypothetical protein CIL05_13335 [Virgibacillus profundi]|uniref:Endolytic murein transglycosylase n=1 Tax=Virgibacillus profundi TaxID=2024555 RepID=A0A2A2IB59_9BACI|nr:endolytic transglycosylase MltG [Virgibacillus profundi]PAV28959.1 hypothetical protein CIL05_13335 [Virgibacillus profundi]PXY53127.1 endolytic transglycosylase MltG [Virgibacillus profundi]
MSKKNKKKSKFKDNLITRSEEARTVRKIVLIIIISLILILVVGGVSGFIYVKSALEPVDPESEENIELEIPIGSSTSSIATILEENGIIKDSRIFRFYIKFKNESDFQAGEYTFSPAMTIDEIIESLKSGKILAEPTYTITIPEGKTIEEMAKIYAGKLHFSEEEFLEKVNDESYVQQLIESYPTILSDAILDPEIKYPLEGYLFAATYSFYENEPTIETVVEKMLTKSQNVIYPLVNEIAAKDLTVHEAVTFASLVEKESGSVDQRKEIAGVFYNRMEEPMKLQTDPTVLYALGGHKEKTLLEDLEVESPYNTYHVDGLPIGPIANFAQTSLEAVINPEETENIYFLHDSEGNIHYAETYEVHLQNKEKYID